MPVVSRRDFLLISSSALFASALASFGGRYYSFNKLLDRMPLPPPNAPNVILIVLDTVRAKNLSLYGYERPTTPNLENIAKHGVLFKNAYSVSPWTLPSHAVMFTAQLPSQINADWTIPLNNTYPTLAEVFSQLGYLTSGFVANTRYCSSEHGLQRGFQLYQDYRKTPGQIMDSSGLARNMIDELKIYKTFANYENFGRKSAEQLNLDFIHWVKQVGVARPFFAFLNYYDAHPPYLPPIDFALKFSDRKPNGFLRLKSSQNLDPEKLRELTDAYDGAIAYLDHQLAWLFNELQSLDLMDHTVIIITSDHGEQFGEHGLMTHGNSLYLPLTKIPLLLIYRDRIPKNTVVASPVSLRDLAGTVLDLAGLSNLAGIPGESWRRHWTGQPAQELVFSEVKMSWDINGVPTPKGWIKSMIYEGWHYIQNPKGREELYFIEDDPDESNNLAESANNRPKLKFFRNSLPD